MNIVIVLVSFLVLPFSIIGYGKLTFQIILRKSYLSNNIGELGFFGIIFISFISTFLHFFFSNKSANKFCYIFCWYIFIFFELRKKILYKKKNTSFYCIVSDFFIDAGLS